MKPEQRVWLASILSAVLLVSYAQFLSQSTPRPTQQPDQPLVQAQDTQKAAQSSIPQLKQDEGVILLETEPLLLEVGRSSATVRSVVLKNYQNLAKRTPLKVEKLSGVIGAGFDDESVSWQLQDASKRKAIWTSKAADGSQRDLTIELDERLPRLVLTLTATNKSSSEQNLPVRILAVWGRSDEMAGQQNPLEALVLTQKTGSFQNSHLRYMDGAKERKIVPRGTILVTLTERFFCQSIKPDPAAPAETSLLPAERGTIVTEITSSLQAKPASMGSYRIEAYIGPRDFFSMREAGFEQAFPVGMLAKIGLMLMVMLKWLASLSRNYGIAVILLSAIITCMLSPFTMISYRSMKKMQGLQPRMDAIRKKYANDTQRANQEVFALFKENRVSPISGCLPMLLQMPIFFALWSAITHVIELRGERFLWIKDLSLPDKLAKLPGGLDLNILPILMAGAMFVQTKLTQPKTSTTSNPFTGPMMSVLFGVMFYSVPAGLVLYWLTNTLTSVAWYKFSKI